MNVQDMMRGYDYDLPLYDVLNNSSVDANGDPEISAEGLRFLTVKSAALGGRADITLYVPETAADAADVPIVLLLHGVYGSHWAWALKGAAHLTLDRLIAAGQVPPMVLAMPSDGLWGDGSGYVAHGMQNFERWVAAEVPAAVAKTVAANAKVRDALTRFAKLCMGELLGESTGGC